MKDPTDKRVIEVRELQITDDQRRGLEIRRGPRFWPDHHEPDRVEPGKLFLALLAGCCVAYGYLAATGSLFQRIPTVDPTAQVLWLGDSITAQGPTTRQGQNLGVPGLRCWHMEHQAARLAGSQAEVVVLNCGANDLAYDRTAPGAIADAVNAALVTLSEVVPTATVLLVGVLPGALVNEEERRETNRMLLELETAGVVFLKPPDQLDTADGLHLSRAGYAQLDAEIGPVVAELVGPELVLP